MQLHPFFAAECDFLTIGVSKGCCLRAGRSWPLRELCAKEGLSSFHISDIVLTIEKKILPGGRNCPGLGAGRSRRYDQNALG